MQLILRLDKLVIVKGWVDASYAINLDCLSDNGAMMSLGWESVASMSKRQNIISRSSAEAEMTGEDNVLPAFLLSRYFIEVQGLEVEEAVMYQDNLIAMILDNNGILSSVNRKKHIHIRYFLNKYRDEVQPKTSPFSTRDII